MSKNSFSFKVEIRWIFLFLFIISIIGCVIFKFWYIDNNKPFGINEIMAYSAGSVAILTLLYHAFGLEYSKTYHKEILEVQRHQYTYDVVSKMNEPEMARCLNTYSYIKNNKDKLFKDGTTSEFEKFIENDDPNDDKQHRVHVIMLLNYFEHLAILVKNQHVEEIIVKDSFKGLFITSYSIMKPYLDFKQSTNRMAWYNYECLAKKWSEE